MVELESLQRSAVYPTSTGFELADTFAKLYLPPPSRHRYTSSSGSQAPSMVLGSRGKDPPPAARDLVLLARGHRTYSISHALLRFVFLEHSLVACGCLHISSGRLESVLGWLRAQVAVSRPRHLRDTVRHLAPCSTA